MKNIIVPTDFSLKSINALQFAKKIAQKTNGTIHLVNVVEPTPGTYSSTGEFLSDEFDDTFTLRLADRQQEKMSELAEKHIGKTYEIDASVKIGFPLQEIRKMIEELDADLLIMGSKGSTDEEDFFLGSFTDKVVRSAKCPVIVVNEVVSNDDVFRNIVYATDLEEEHKAMINFLMRIQDLFDSNLHIVKINTRRNFKNDIETNIEFQQLVAKYGLRNYTTTVYNHEDEEYGIVHFADMKKADLIAIGIHERSGFRRLISGGSLATEVKDHTYRPVLTLRFE